MIPMPISPEEYAQVFTPAPDYIVCERVHVDIDSIRGIHTPRAIQDGMQRFIGVGRVLAVSPHKSDDPHIEEMKEIIRDSRYVGFEFHVVAEVAMLPQFELPRNCQMICMHVKDVVYLPKKLDELFEKQKAYEAENAKTALVG